jgi:hypothetical protein
MSVHTFCHFMNLVLFFSSVHAEAVLKGTNVDGVYDCTSRDNNFTFEHISFRDLASRGVTYMDSMALNYCEENNIPGLCSLLCLFWFRMHLYIDTDILSSFGYLSQCEIFSVTEN